MHKAQITVGCLFLLTVALAISTAQSLPFVIVIGSVPLFAFLSILWWRQSGDEGNNPHFRFMLLAGALAHIVFTCVADPLFTSDDINRYVFEGHVVVAGGNPYRFSPASPIFDDMVASESLGQLRRGINNAGIATIYPPLAECLFGISTLISPGPRGWMIVTLAFDLLLIFMLPKLLSALRRDKRWSVVYVWHPVVLLEGLGGGHVDLVAVALLVCSLVYACHNRRFVAWILFALSVLTKVVSLIVAFSLLRKSGWRGAVFGALLAIAAVLWCFRSGTIEPTVQTGVWQDQQRDKAETSAIEIQKGESIFGEAQGSQLLIASSGKAAVKFVLKSENELRPEQVLYHEDLQFGGPMSWDMLLGQYYVCDLESTSANGELPTIRFDGQGRFLGSFTGKYWIEDEHILVIANSGQEPLRFLMAQDGQFAKPYNEGNGTFLLKFDEKVGMGFRHYGSRWTANAPLFRLIKSWVPGTDVYDAKRKVAQKLVAGLLLLLAAVFALRKVALPCAAIWLFFCLWALAPAVYPWYLLWLIPFVGFTKSKAPLVLTYTCLAMHLGPDWGNPEYLVYAPVVAALVADGLLFAKGKFS